MLRSGPWCYITINDDQVPMGISSSTSDKIMEACPLNTEGASRIPPLMPSTCADGPGKESNVIRNMYATEDRYARVRSQAHLEPVGPQRVPLLVASW